MPEPSFSQAHRDFLAAGLAGQVGEALARHEQAQAKLAALNLAAKDLSLTQGAPNSWLLPQILELQAYVAVATGHALATARLVNGAPPPECATITAWWEAHVASVRQGQEAEYKLAYDTQMAKLARQQKAMDERRETVIGAWKRQAKL